MRKAQSIAFSNVYFGVFLFLVLSFQSNGQHYQIMQYSREAGLPSAVVHDINQDATGRMWFATKGGLVCYDSREFKLRDPFETKSLLETAFLRKDEAGDLWYCTVHFEDKNDEIYVDLARLTNGQWQVYHPLLIPVSDIGMEASTTRFEVLGSNENFEALLSYRGVRLFHWEKEQWKRLKNPSNTIVGLSSEKDNFLLLNDTSLIRLIGQHRMEIIASQITGDNFIGMTKDSKSSTTWIHSKNGLQKFENKHLELVTTSTAKELDQYTHSTMVHSDRSGGLFYGNKIALYYYDPRTLKTTEFGVDEGLITSGATSIYIDREDNIWISSMRGLSKIFDRRFITYTRRHGLYEDEVTAVHQTKDGRIVLGHNSGLTVFDRGNLIRIPFTSPYLIKRVMDITEDATGTVWLALSDIGVGRLDINNNIVFFGEESGLEGTTNSVEYHTDGILYASSTTYRNEKPNNALYRFENDNFIPSRFDNEVFSIRKVFSSADSTLYLATNIRGIVSINGTDLKFINSENINQNRVYSYYEVSDGTKWVGTIAGLCKIQDDRIVKTHLGQQTIDESVYCILEDTESRLWMGTENGVYVWDGSKLSQFTSTDGFLGNEVNRAASIVDNFGRVWMGTNLGVSVFQEDEFGKNTIPPLVEMINVSSRSDALDLSRPLKRDINDITFHFLALSFVKENEVKYKVKLEGYDKDWSEAFSTSTNQMRYTHLPPGEYQFFVKAAGINETWSDAVSTLKFIVPPPYWATWWFLVSASIVLIVLIYAILYFYTVHIKQKNIRLMHEVIERSKAEKEIQDLLTTMQDKNEQLTTKNAEMERFNYTVSHDLKSPLITIKGYTGMLLEDLELNDPAVLKNDIEKIDDAANHMNHLLNQLLELSRMGRVVNEIELTDIREVVEGILRNMQGPLEGITIKIQDDLPNVYCDPTRIAEVFQNLVENAAKFITRFADARITIGGSKKNEKIEFFVHDNGPGIPKEYQIKIFEIFERLNSEVSGTGIGLALSKRIIEAHGGKIWVESKGIGTGSTFKFSLPSKIDQLVNA